MSAFPTIILAQINLIGSALGVAVTIVLSFVTITLVASYYRFQHIVEQAEEKSPEEMGTSANEVLRVQLARFLAGCARRGTSFSVGLIRAHTPIESHMQAAIKCAARRDDICCEYDGETLALLAESEPEDAESIFSRIIASMAAACDDVILEEIRVGIASYPGHGLSGKILLEVAEEGLNEAVADRPVVLAEMDEEDEDEEEEQPASEDADEADDVEAEEGTAKKWRALHKKEILDPVTGVLKPSTVSTYMQRVMSDVRYKKKRAALFCIGVNNMDHIARFHGEAVANDVLAGISRILQDHLRSDDLIGRHEQYAFLVLAQCTLEEAADMVKRINSLVLQAQFESGHKKLKTTLSLGVASFPEHGRNLHQLYTAGQKVLDYNRENDIRSCAVYDPEIHDKVPAKPMKSIKAVNH
jgi:diguanylate cyclase (GGDEF)-like protein